MALKKISELPAVTSLLTTDILPVVASGVTSKITVANLRAAIVGSVSIDGLSDVTITTPASGQILKYNGTVWINSTLALDDLSDVTVSGAGANHGLRHNGSVWVNTAQAAWLDTANTFTAANIWARANGSSITTGAANSVFEIVQAPTDTASALTVKAVSTAAAIVELYKNQDTTPALVLKIDATGELGLGVDPVAGDGLIQLANGTTKATGIKFGNDVLFYRNTNYSVMLTDIYGTDGGIELKPGYLTVGKDRTGSSNVYFALISEAGVTSYNFLFERAPGPNSPINMTNTGTGDIKYRLNDGAVIYDFTMNGFRFPTYVDDPILDGGNNTGMLFWSQAQKSLAYWNDAVKVHLGQETVLRVRNTSASNIPAGRAVYVTGVTGSTLNVALATNATDAGSQVVGLATAAIAINDYGYIVTGGTVHNLDTSSIVGTPGDPLWLGTVGDYSTTRPTSPTRQIQVGVLSYVHNNQGKIYVRVADRTPAATTTNMFSGFANGSASGAVVIDASNGTIQTLSITGNITSFAVSNPPSVAGMMKIIVINSTGSTYTLALPSSWINTVTLTPAATLSIAAGGRLIINAQYIASTSEWVYGLYTSSGGGGTTWNDIQADATADLAYRLTTGGTGTVGSPGTAGDTTGVGLMREFRSVAFSMKLAGDIDVFVPTAGQEWIPRVVMLYFDTWTGLTTGSTNIGVKVGSSVVYFGNNGSTTLAVYYNNFTAGQWMNLELGTTGAARDSITSSKPLRVTLSSAGIAGTTANVRIHCLLMRTK